jgi:DNA repair exonuclease SbcCD ATPase subunit
VAKAELSFNGLVGVMEAMLEAAKGFQEFEERYLANEAGFQSMQQQFRQMQEGAGQLQSLAEERLAALANLNVELKARYSQGEQVLADVRAAVEEAKAWQAAAEKSRQCETERVSQLAQMLEVMQALVDKLQNRQAQIEQSLVAVEALSKDQGKRNGDAENLTQRQDQLEKALANVEATKQAEKSLFTHFEKTLNGLKGRVSELERRPAPQEGNGSEPAGTAVADLEKKVEELRQAVEKAAAAAISVPVAAAGGEGGAAPEEFRQFLTRCEEDYKAALERENKLAAQWRKALDSLPSRAEGAIQKFLEQNQGRLEQSFGHWLQQREQRAAELEKREEGQLNKVIEKQRSMENEMAKLAGGGGSSVSTEWTQTIEALSASHTNEIRFLKTLLWITLAAVGLSYGLVAYAVILRSS